MIGNIVFFCMIRIFLWGVKGFYSVDKRDRRFGFISFLEFLEEVLLYVIRSI